MGRVVGLAVALGLGAAITAWSSGLAWADESGGTAESTASSDASGTEPAPANPEAAEGTAKPGDIGTTRWRGALGTSWRRHQHRRAHPG